MVSARVLLVTALLGAVEAQKVSNNARCGRDFGMTCAGSKYGNCCSQYGYCGNDNSYCAASACQKGYGSCNGQSPPASIPPVVAPPGQAPCKPSTVTITSAGQSTTCPAGSKTTVTSVTTVTPPRQMTTCPAASKATVTSTVTLPAQVSTLTVPTTISLPAVITTATIPTTITLPAEVSTLTVSNTISLPGAVVTTTVTNGGNACSFPSPSATQAVSDPSFEGSGYWVFFGGPGSVGTVEGGQRTGSRSAQVISNNAGNPNLGVGQTVTLVPNAGYRLDVYVKATTAGKCTLSATIGRVQIAFSDSSVGDSYALKSGLYYPVAGATSGYLSINIGCNNPTGQPLNLYMDDVTLTIAGFYQPL